MRVVAALGCIVLALAACRQPGPEADPEQESAPAPAPVVPARVTPADFQSLRWLEGYWRGTGGDVPAFHEGYQFVNDSTIRGLLFTDSTLAEVADSIRIVVSGGVLTSGGAATTATATATEIDADHVHFVREGGGGTYTWTRESPTAWSAHLTATMLGQQQERTYRMERIEAPPGH